MAKIQIVVVDDHPIFRQGVVDSLAMETDFEVIGQAEDGREGLQVIMTEEPDIAIVDVNLPEMNGQQLTRHLTAQRISTRVVLLTAYDDSSQAVHSMTAGAAAYCAKDIDPQKLIEVIRKVGQGKFVISEEVYDEGGLKSWLDQRTDLASTAYSDPGDPYDPLSNREMQVLECVTLGMSNKEIALELGISHQTVKNHVTAILRKLRVDDRTQAAVFALRQGWVRLYSQPEKPEE